MLNQTILIKIQQRLNKLGSQDFQNLPAWQMLEAFNNSMVEWCRTTLKNHADDSTTSLEDLQNLLTSLPLDFTDKGIYYQSNATDWPTNFLRNERVELYVTKECCPEPKRMTVYLGEEANVDIYLNDVNIRPNYAWEYTFFVMSGNTLKIYHEKEFDISSCNYIYYREPLRVQITGVVDVYQTILPTVDILCEFPDNLVEVFVNAAGDMLAGDIENVLQQQRLAQIVQTNS